MDGDRREAELAEDRRAWAAVQFHNATRLRSPWSHDLRQPLHSASLNLELLSRNAEEGGDLAEERRRYIGVIREKLDDVRRGLDVLRDLLEPATSEFRSFDLVALATEVTGLLEPMARHRGIELSSSIPEEEITLEGQEDRLQQVLLTVALDALERLPGGSSMAVRVERGEDHAAVGLSCAGNGSTSSEALWSGDGGEADGRPGSRDGLALTEALVAAHDGSLSQGEPEAGRVRLTVRLPLPGDRR